MLVRMLIGRYAGDVRDMPAHIAHRMIEDGKALSVHPEPETTAIEPQTEQAVRKRGRPRKVNVTMESSNG